MRLQRIYCAAMKQDAMLKKIKIVISFGQRTTFAAQFNKRSQNHMDEGPDLYRLFT